MVTLSLDARAKCQPKNCCCVTPIWIGFKLYKHHMYKHTVSSNFFFVTYMILSNRCRKVVHIFPFATSFGIEFPLPRAFYNSDLKKNCLNLTLVLNLSKLTHYKWNTHLLRRFFFINTQSENGNSRMLRSHCREVWFKKEMRNFKKWSTNFVEVCSLKRLLEDRCIQCNSVKLTLPIVGCQRIRHGAPATVHVLPGKPTSSRLARS